MEVQYSSPLPIVSPALKCHDTTSQILAFMDHCLRRFLPSQILAASESSLHRVRIVDPQKRPSPACDQRVGAVKRCLELVTKQTSDTIIFKPPMTKTFKIVVLGGDGIGPEVTQQAVRLLRQIEPHLDGVAFDFDEHNVGVGEYQKNGEALPASAFKACQASDAILLGAMGLPDVRYPNGKEIAPQLDLREQLQLYGGVRPIRLYHADDTPLKAYGSDDGLKDIDFVLVRESTEGIFAGRDAVADTSADEATNIIRITRNGARRVCRMAFQVARKRDKAKKVTLIDKANVLSTMVYFRHIFDEVAKEYPDITADHVYVDASALFMVRRPHDFDVMVTENMFGDILSDLAAGLVGGMGMAPSADIGDSAAVFQPSHGSAPDIAGQGIANPIAMILSAAMMLDWLDHDETRRAAVALHNAVAITLSNPLNRTPDMGGELSTSQITDAVAAALDETIVTAAT